MVVEVRAESPEETKALGETFGALLVAGDFVALMGDLGAGKTLFTKGVATALGCEPDDVASPTFTLVREYHGRVTLYHLDIYRLEDPEDELIDIGYEEFFEPDDGITVVEWAQGAKSLLPRRRWDVRLVKADQARRIEVSAVGIARERIERMRETLGRKGRSQPATPGDAL